MLAVFLFGALVGYLYSRDAEKTQTEKTRTVIAISVTLVWITAMIADILIANYVISPLVHAIMGAVVGYFFADKGVNINLGQN